MTESYQTNSHDMNLLNFLKSFDSEKLILHCLEDISIHSPPVPDHNHGRQWFYLKGKFS